MKQTDPIQLERAKEELSRLKEARGGQIGPGHYQLANDPALLRAFTDTYVDCCVNETRLPEKYRQMILMALCSARGYTIAVNHARQAAELGATPEEMGEVIRLILNVCGVPAILSVMDVFEQPDIEL